MPDYIDPALGLPLALFLWVLLLFVIFHKRIIRWFDDFFAQRRHNRRLRNAKRHARRLYRPNAKH
jgi:hypothetical protein